MVENEYHHVLYCLTDLSPGKFLSVSKLESAGSFEVYIAFQCLFILKAYKSWFSVTQLHAGE